MKRKLLAALALSLALNPAFGADFAEGLRAYDAGDYAAAYAEWLALAKEGDAEAQIALAGLYFQGLGAAQSFAKATEWYRRAAEQGLAVAQMNLGEMYATARGVERDLARAYFWLSLAADQGKGWAAERREVIAARMSANERARAEALLKGRRAGR